VGIVSAVVAQFGTEPDLPRRHDVVAEHDLVLALEDVVPDGADLDDVEVQFFLHLALYRGPRVLFRLQIARDEREPSFGPTGVARQDDVSLVLDECPDGRRRVAPLHEPARGVDARPPHRLDVVAAAASFGHLPSAARAEFEGFDHCSFFTTADTCSDSPCSVVTVSVTLSPSFNGRFRSSKAM